MMMNQDEKFQQRWEFRRGGDDEDSSTDDSKSSSHRVDKKHNIVNHLLLNDDDEVSDSPRCHQGDKIESNNCVVPFHPLQVAEKKVKSSKKKEKKKNVVPMRSLVVAKGNKKRKRNLVSKDMVMLDDLKTFADSLIHELKVARENMSAQVKKLAASRLRKKKVGCCKKKAQNGSSVERSMKSNVTSDISNSPKAVVEYDRTENELQKGEKLILQKRARTILTTDSDRVVSSLFLPPKPQLQCYDNGIPPNDTIPGGVRRENSDSEIEIGYHPNALIQTYSENLFRDRSEGSRGGNSATLKFSDGNITAASEYAVWNDIRSDVHRRTETEYVPLRMQELKNDHVYLASFRNKQ